MQMHASQEQGTRFRWRNGEAIVGGVPGIKVVERSCDHATSLSFSRLPTTSFQPPTPHHHRRVPPLVPRSIVRLSMNALRIIHADDFLVSAGACSLGMQPISPSPPTCPSSPVWHRNTLASQPDTRRSDSPRRLPNTKRILTLTHPIRTKASSPTTNILRNSASAPPVHASPGLFVSTYSTLEELAKEMYLSRRP